MPETADSGRVAPAGAPFELLVPIVAENGQLDSDVQSVTIEPGATASPVVGIAEASEATGDVTVDIGMLPDPPTDHRGYEIVKSGRLPLHLAGVCGRTAQVRGAIVSALGAGDCAGVTDEDLAGLSGTLDLAGLGIESLWPSDFEGLESLQRLLLWDNGLTALPDGVFDGLSSLEELWLSENRLSRLQAGTFAALSSLKGLYLHNNALAVLPSGAFDGLLSLETLNLSGNRLTELPVDVFAGLRSLLELRLAYNRLKTLTAGVFAGLSSLTTLDLSGNRLTSLPPGLFEGLPSLTNLYLHSNPLRAMPPRTFQGLSSLRRLSLSESGLATVPDGVFAGLRSLDALDLRGNAIDPLPLNLRIEPAGGGRFRVAIPSGAPFRMAVPIEVANGRIEGGAATVEIPAGATASPAFAVLREPGAAETAPPRFGTLPALPSNHVGYVLSPTNDRSLGRDSDGAPSSRRARRSASRPGFSTPRSGRWRCRRPPVALACWLTP